MSIYNLEERTFQFSKDIISICKKLPRNIINLPLVNQIIRSATSIGANYREANDGLGRKDFIRCLRIARKEAKETSYWLELLLDSNKNYKRELEHLVRECIELRNILSSIINKSV